MESRETMVKACEELGVKHVAAEMEVSTSVLYNQINDPNRTDLLKRFIDFCKATENDTTITWACEKLGGVFIPNKEISAEEIEAVSTAYVSKSVKEFGDVITVIGEAIQDGEITANEALKIKKEWEDLKRLLEGFVHVCIDMHEKKLTGKSF